MDEASQIVADLRRKLVELDYKVVQYRHEMCSEFEKCTKEILRNVTQDVSAEVTKAINASLKKYPNLYPELQNATTTSIDQQKRGGSPSILGQNPDSHVSQDEQPRSPHEREREFTGVFTPSYLPLLDSTDRHERRSSQEMRKQSEAEKSENPNSPVMQTIVADPAHPSTPTVILQRPPTPLRKNTDNSVLSYSSDSDSALRKSALRRSSSSASHNLLSPRKVRFSLEGQEYPTDSTPKPSTIEEEPPKPKRTPIILGFRDDSDDEAGTEQVEDIDKPPPKRISSSQALRALSRGPLEDDDGTKWTMVAAPPDGSASVPVDQEIKSGKAYIDADDDEEIADHGGTVTGAKADEAQEGGSQNLSQVRVDDSPKPMISQKAREDEKTLSESLPIKSAIPSSSSEQGKMNSATTAKSQIIAGPSQSIPTSTAKAPANLKRKKSTFTLADSDSESDAEEENSGGNINADDDELFDFEDGDESRNKENNPGKAKANPDISRFSPSDVRSPRMISGLGTGMRGGSLTGSYDGTYDSGESGQTQTVGTPSGIDYSYKGSKNHYHPFKQPIASERAQREARQMGNMQSWVGSVDGRSGVDDRPGDSGFRGSLGPMAGSLPGGRPRSFSEKLRMEEEMERANAKK